MVSTVPQVVKVVKVAVREAKDTEADAVVAAGAVEVEEGEAASHENQESHGINDL